MLGLLEIIRQHPINPIFVVVSLAGTYVVYNVVTRARSLHQLQGPPSRSFLSGHLPQFYDPINGDTFYTMLRNNYGMVCRLKGMLGEDQLWVSDPRALQEIAVKENNSFLISKEFAAFTETTFGSTMLTVHGERHRLQKKLLSPAFTPKHLRGLVSTFTTLTQQMESAILSDMRGEETATVDVFKWVNLLWILLWVMEGKGDEVLRALSRLFPVMTELWWIRPFLPWLKNIGPGFFRRFIVEWTPSSSVKELVKITDILNNMAVDIHRQKKNAIANVSLHDQQNEILPTDQQMPEDEVIAQIFGFVFAGSDTTSSAITTVIYLLAQHTEVQEKLHTEIQEAYQRYGQDLNYEQLHSLTLLDAVCRESLRLFPSQPILERTAMKDWTLPLQQQVMSSDGKTTMTHVPVKKGMQIYISLDAANRDKQIWGDDANEFRPSRWLEELPLSVKDSNLPSAYSSIGIKFSQLEMSKLIGNAEKSYTETSAEVVLSRLIHKFKFAFGEEIIRFNINGVYQPYVVQGDGTQGTNPSMPLKVTLVGGSE
ncbi:cytochrome P450 [Rhizoctonia solani]|uniref:Cytochrome P450 n=1 Tax=Rhizoctonia solani TaxID=456999 RepID=A0A8H7IAB1_9AGAM|nr:cytochrome P450 [Rhizoctonia solani]